MTTEHSGVIRVDRVTRRYGDVAAVEDVSLEVKRGEFLTLLGPSGSGKTTLLRLIAGFDRPDGGRIYLGGKDVTEAPPYRRHVHTVFQQYVLFPHLNVFENIAFGLGQRKLPRREIERRVGEVLNLVRLSGYEHRKPDQLSGGEQQRVAVARAIVLEPDALLLDEPLAALDVKLRQEMQLELKRLQRQLRISFLLVTHDQEEAMTMSDRIAVIADGRIRQIGTPRDVYERPETEFVANFIGLSNVFEAKVLSVNQGRATLEFHGHRVERPTDGKRLDGSRVRCAVRPEMIDLRSEPLGDPDLIQLQGVVDDQVYLGDAVRWRVRLGEDLVTVSEPNRPGSRTEPVRPGQEVILSWAPENIILLPE